MRGELIGLITSQAGELGTRYSDPKPSEVRDDLTREHRWLFMAQLLGIQAFLNGLLIHFSGPMSIWLYSTMRG